MEKEVKVYEFTHITGETFCSTLIKADSEEEAWRKSKEMFPYNRDKMEKQRIKRVR